MNQNARLYRTVLGMVTLFTLSVLSCSREELASPKADTLSATANPEKGAFTEHSQTWLELDRVLDAPCANGGAGEDIQFNGKVHWNDQLTINENGFVLVSQANTSSVEGYGLVSGNLYKLGGAAQYVISERYTQGQFTGMYQERLNIIGQGATAKMVAVVKAKITVNANGEITREVEDVTIECQE